MMISQAASSELARSARAQVRRSSRRQSLSLQTPVGTGVIPFSKDSGIKRYGCLAPVLRIRARREQLRGHYRAVIKNLLEQRATIKLMRQATRVRRGGDTHRIAHTRAFGTQKCRKGGVTRSGLNASPKKAKVS